MSLLEQILSGIKRQSPTADVPPGLKRIVSASIARQRTRKRIAIIGMFALFMVALGFGAVFFLEPVPGRSLRPQDSRNTLQALQGLKADALQTGSIPQAATPDSPQSPPLPPTKIVKPTDFSPQRSNPSAEGADGGKLDFRPAHQSGSPTGTKRAGKANEVVTSSAQPFIGPEKQESSSIDKAEKDLHLYSAKSYESAGDLGKALGEYRKALEWDRDNYIILNNTAGVLIRLGLFKDAGVYARRSLVIKKDHVPSLVNMGVALLKSGDIEEGARYLTEALQLAPTDRPTLSNLGLTYEKTGQYVKAYELYRRLAAMDDVDGHLSMARVCEKESRQREAEAIYRNILKRDVDKRAKKLASERLAALGSIAEAKQKD